MSFQDLRAIALFDGLSDSQLLELMTVGEELDFNPGEELFGEARPADYWWVLLGGPSVWCAGPVTRRQCSA